MYACTLPFGCTSTTGPRHVAGSDSRVLMVASPSADSGTCAVVAAGVVESPQKSEADTVLTGPALPTPVITRPRMRTLVLPSRWIETEPPPSHGTPPGATPWRVGSVGAGLLPTRADAKTFLPLCSPLSWPRSAAAETVNASATVAAIASTAPSRIFLGVIAPPESSFPPARSTAARTPADCGVRSVRAEGGGRRGSRGRARRRVRLGSHGAAPGPAGRPRAAAERGLDGGGPPARTQRAAGLLRRRPA